MCRLFSLVELGLAQAMAGLIEGTRSGCGGWFGGRGLDEARSREMVGQLGSVVVGFGR